MTEEMTVNNTRDMTGSERQQFREVEAARRLTVADYEARIHLYKEQIGVGYIGIGRTLNEAKEAGVVPAGQWEAWVQDVTGLTVRQAQRCMQAAREIRDGSALARLEMSKAMRLLSSGLDEDQREELAEKVSQDELTVKELEAEIRNLKRDRDQTVELARSWEQRARESFAEGQKAAQRAGDVEDNLRMVQKDEEIRKLRQDVQKAQTARDNLQRAVDQEALRRGDAELQLDSLRQQLHGMDQARKIAEHKLQTQEAAAQEQYRIGMAAGEEIGKKHAQQEADQLRQRINDQERLIREKTQELQQLKLEKRQQQMAEARGVPVQAGPDGVFPYNAERPISEMILLMISKTGAMDPAVYRKDKALAGELTALENWIGRARALIGVDADGSVE